MTNVLPDVKFENFAAAKTCLQTTLSSTGAIVKTLSIQSDQNGKDAWAVTIAASGTFPAPTPENFVRVRAVLNQHIPNRGVLRQITRICQMSATEEWLWLVTYGVKKNSRIRAAITALNAAIRQVTPCLKTTPILQTAIRKKEKLTNLEQLKNRRRFFYKRRTAKKAVITTDTVSKSDAKYSNFVKGEVLHPNKADRIQTKTHNFAPKYDEWDVNGLFFYMKNLTITDAKAMSIITSCKGQITDVQSYAAAVYHMKNRCPHMTKTQLPLVYKKTLERLGVDARYIASISLNSDLFSRVSVKDHGYYYNSSNHIMCSHD